jgi:hypothetical protein
MCFAFRYEVSVFFVLFFFLKKKKTDSLFGCRERKGM